MVTNIQSIQQPITASPPQEAPAGAPVDATTAPAGASAPVPVGVPNEVPVNPADNVDINAQIEEGLSQLPENAKELLATFSIVPEFSELMGAMFGAELGNFLNQFSDPDLTISIVPKDARAKEGSNQDMEKAGTNEQSKEDIVSDSATGASSEAFGKPVGGMMQ